MILYNSAVCYSAIQYYIYITWCKAYHNAVHTGIQGLLQALWV